MEDLVMSGGFWAGRRVFLTGHTGLKGSWLSLLLKRFGAEVYGYALSPLPDSIFTRAGVAASMASSTIADVRDLDSLRSALVRSNAEIVFHLAAQPLVRESYVTPVETYATNVMGTVHLLDAVRTTGNIRSVVVVTSDKCYENKEWCWGYRETEPMGGHDPYSNSKGCAELVTSAYRSSFFKQGTRIATGRAGNVIGGGDMSRDRLIPDIVRALRAGGAPLIRFPGAIRPWQHVLEPIVGYVQLAAALAGEDGEKFTDGWNFGPPSEGERTVRDVVDIACDLWGQSAMWEMDTANHPHEANFLKLDSSKARRYLHWRPVLDFEQTIAMTLDWYKAEDAGSDMRAFTHAQIEHYLKLVA